MVLRPLEHIIRMNLEVSGDEGFIQITRIPIKMEKMKNAPRQLQIWWEPWWEVDEKLYYILANNDYVCVLEI